MRTASTARKLHFSKSVWTRSRRYKDVDCSSEEYGAMHGLAVRGPPTQKRLLRDKRQAQGEKDRRRAERKKGDHAEAGRRQVLHAVLFVAGPLLFFLVATIRTPSAAPRSALWKAPFSTRTRLSALLTGYIITSEIKRFSAPAGT